MAININDFKEGVENNKRKYITQIGLLQKIDECIESGDEEKQAEVIDLIKQHYTMCDGTLVENVNSTVEESNDDNDNDNDNDDDQGVSTQG